MDSTLSAFVILEMKCRWVGLYLKDGSFTRKVSGDLFAVVQVQFVDVKACTQQIRRGEAFDSVCCLLYGVVVSFGTLRYEIHKHRYRYRLAASGSTNRGCP